MTKDLEVPTCDETDDWEENLFRRTGESDNDDEEEEEEKETPLDPKLTLVEYLTAIKK